MKHQDDTQAMEENLDLAGVFIKGVSEKYSTPFNEVLELLKKKEEKLLIPTYIFREKKLGILEALTKHLKEDYGMAYHKIAVILKRDDRVVWTTYNKAAKKKKESFSIAGQSRWIPVSVFTEKKLGPLESLSKYLVENSHLKISQAARLLDKNPKSVWA